MGVSISAASVVPWQELAEANAPLVEVVARAAPWFPAQLLRLKGQRIWDTMPCGCPLCPR